VIWQRPQIVRTFPVITHVENKKIIVKQ